MAAVAGRPPYHGLVAIRIESLKLVFWKRRAGEIATLRFYHKAFPSANFLPTTSGLRLISCDALMNGYFALMDISFGRFAEMALNETLQDFCAQSADAPVP